MDDELKRKAIRSGIGFGIVKFISQIFTWTITVIVMKLLTTSDYGLMAISLPFLQLAQFLVQGGFDVVIVRKVDITQVHLVYLCL